MMKLLLLSSWVDLVLAVVACAVSVWNLVAGQPMLAALWFGGAAVSFLSFKFKPAQWLLQRLFLRSAAPLKI